MKGAYNIIYIFKTHYCINNRKLVKNEEEININHVDGFNTFRGSL